MRLGLSDFCLIQTDYIDDKTLNYLFVGVHELYNGAIKGELLVVYVKYAPSEIILNLKKYYALSFCDN